jgi:hypothetical protein
LIGFVTQALPFQTLIGFVTQALPFQTLMLPDPAEGAVVEVFAHDAKTPEVICGAAKVAPTVIVPFGVSTAVAPECVAPLLPYGTSNILLAPDHVVDVLPLDIAVAITKPPVCVVSVAEGAAFVEVLTSMAVGFMPNAANIAILTRAMDAE